MSTHRYIDRICVAVILIAMVVTVVFMNGNALGIEAVASTMGYENRLFDTSTVHQIDLVMDDWDGFLETCENEEYVNAAIVIDGDSYKNVGIRAKGNTSLSTVSSLGSDRYSLKIEFDHYDSGKSYYGLDKLCLNNIIQDTTYMKDYLAYQLMAANGVAAPLCSYAYITINGEDWGLYLAVEDVEDGFLARNYGSDSGELYKPDSQSFGAGRGNGKDFDMDDFDFDSLTEEQTEQIQEVAAEFGVDLPDDFDEEDLKEAASEFMEQNGGSFGGDPGSFGGSQGGFGGGKGQPGDENTQPTAPNQTDQTDQSTDGQPSESGDMPQMPSDDQQNMQPGDFGGGEQPDGFGGGDGPDGNGRKDGGDQGGGMSMGSADVKLQYIDDDPDSYSNIFDNAKTKISDSDKTRLIESLKSLSSYEDIEDVVDVDQVLRYFVVHNFMCNGDSYTGSMVHNYYLYEKDGQLSMIPWDYNLSFGAFQSSSAGDTVNSPIDSPVSGGTVDDRPMVGWIFSDESYTEMYHEYFSEFLNSVDIVGLITETQELIAPYVEKDPTKFYTYEEFETGVETLKEFCQLRIESIQGQLDGTIGSTSDAQNADPDSLIDASDLNISDMGSMNNQGGQGGGPGGDQGGGPGSQGMSGGDPGNQGMPGGDSGGTDGQGMQKPDDTQETENQPDA